MNGVTTHTILVKQIREEERGILGTSETDRTNGYIKDRDLLTIRVLFVSYLYHSFNYSQYRESYKRCVLIK